MWKCCNEPEKMRFFVLEDVLQRGPGPSLDLLAVLLFHNLMNKISWTIDLSFLYDLFCLSNEDGIFDSFQWKISFICTIFLRPNIRNLAPTVIMNRILCCRIIRIQKNIWHIPTNNPLINKSTNSLTDWCFWMEGYWWWYLGTKLWTLLWFI